MLRFNYMFGEYTFTTRTGIQREVVYNHQGVGNIQQQLNVEIVFSGDPHEVARSRLLNNGYVVDIDKVREVAATKLPADEFDYVHEPGTIVIQVFDEHNINVTFIRTWMDILANCRVVWVNMRHAMLIYGEMMQSYNRVRENIELLGETDAFKFATDDGVTDLDKMAKHMYDAYTTDGENADNMIRLFALYTYVRSHGEVNDLI